MKRLSLLLFFLLMPILVLANKAGVINPPYDSIHITEWIESNRLNGIDLEANIVIKLFVSKRLLNATKEFKFEFSPEENPSINQLAARDIKFIVCEDNPIGYNHDGGDIIISCINNLPFKIDPAIRYEPKGYKDYILTIDVSDMKWKGYESTTLIIKINYIIPNFVEGKIEKFLMFTSTCFPTNLCPSFTNIIKIIALPKESALRIYPKDTILDRQGEYLTLIFNDFTPYSGYHGQYEKKVVMYTDLNEERKSQMIWFGLNISLGILIAIIIEVLFYFFLDKKNRILIESYLNLIKINLNKLKTKLNNQNGLLKLIIKYFKNEKIVKLKDKKKK